MDAVRRPRRRVDGIIRDDEVCSRIKIGRVRPTNRLSDERPSVFGAPFVAVIIRRLIALALTFTTISARFLEGKSISADSAIVPIIAIRKSDRIELCFH